MQLVRHLPADLPASIFVVLHVPAQGTSLLPGILSRKGRLPARHPDDGEEIRHGQITIAPAGHPPPGQPRPGPPGRAGPARTGIGRPSTRCSGPRRGGAATGSSGSSSRGASTTGRPGSWPSRSGGGVAIVQDPDEACIRACPGLPWRRPRSTIACPWRRSPCARPPGLPAGHRGRSCRRDSRHGHGVSDRGIPARGDPRRAAARQAVGLRLPRLRRGDLGARRGRARPLSLPRRPRLDGQQPGRRAVRGGRGRPLDRLPRIGRAGGAVPPDRRSAPRPEQRHLGRAILRHGRRVARDGRRRK